MADEEKKLIHDAKKTLKHCKSRWDDFREKSGEKLDDYVVQSVDYVQDVLDDKSSPRDWVKGGLALWIQGYGTTRSIWDSAYRLLFPTGHKE